MQKHCMLDVTLYGEDIFEVRLYSGPTSLTFFCFIPHFSLYEDTLIIPFMALKDQQSTRAILL